MNITKLELKNFRNYKNLKIDQFKQKNIIIGSNGSGKTSILESIYVGSITKTFKSNTEQVIIKKGESTSNIKIETNDSGIIKKLEVKVNEKGKKTKINGNLKKRLSDYISVYKVIVYSPDEIRIIKNSPATRRSYLNIQISQINKYYISKLNNYNTLIKNKNEYLRKMYLNKNLDEKYLDILDIKISELGKQIYDYRKEYINKINNYIEKIIKKFNKNSTLFIEYDSDFKNLDESKILKLLHKSRKKEIINGMTCTGIHRDDYNFIFNGENAKEFCSQGIQKLIVLAMKLSEVEIIIKDYGLYPILLLDDLFSELDIKNQNQLIKILNSKNQIFITTTDIKNLEPKLIRNSKIIDIDEMEDEK